MDDASQAPRASKPYFLPPSVDFKTLPEAVKLALDAVVQPAYEELVLGAATALERSAGITIVYALAEEVIQQFTLGATMDFRRTHSSDQFIERERQIRSHLRLVNSKQSASSFLLKIRALRQKEESTYLATSPGQDGIHGKSQNC